MKKIYIYTIAIMLFTPLMSQNKTSFSNLSPKEIRQFLLTQNESEFAKALTLKHNTSRISAYSFLAASFIMAVISGKTKNPDNDNTNSILFSLGAGTSFIIAGACGIVASERLEKAKNTYLNNNLDTEKQSRIQIRNESQIIDSIFKYPTPH